MLKSENRKTFLLKDFVLRINNNNNFLQKHLTDNCCHSPPKHCLNKTNSCWNGLTNLTTVIKNPKKKKEEQHPAKVFGRFHSAFWVVAAEGKDWFRLVGRIDDRVRQRR
jgi:hypothetical protein